MNLSRKLLAVFVALALPTVSVASELTNVESAKFKVKIGGFFYGAAHFDTNEAGSRPWLITVGGDSKRSALSIDPFGTRINLGVESQVADAAVAKGFLEFDWGNNGSLTSGSAFVPRLRHAYASIDTSVVGVLVGQFWLPYLPVNVDTFSPNYFRTQGNTWSRVPQLTLFKTVGPVKAFLTLAQSSGAVGSITSGSPLSATPAPDATFKGFGVIEQPVPAAFLQLAYYVNPKSFIAVVGGYSRPVVGYTAAGASASTATNSVYGDIGANLAFGSLSVSGKVFYGVGGALGSGVGQGLVINAENNAVAVPALGGVLSAKYAITPAFAVALYGGLDDPTDTVSGVNLATRRNLTLGGNVAYTAVEGGVLALELMNVSTTKFAGTTESTYSDLRASLVARYSF